MAGIQLGGLFTGIDTGALIAQLMEVEQATINRLKAQQKTWTDRGTALTDLETKLEALQSAAGAVDSLEELRAFTVTSSNDAVLTAEASGGAFEGSHTILVNQLAGAERWVHAAGQAYAEDPVGAGTFL